MKALALLATWLLGLGSALAAPFAYVPNELAQLVVMDVGASKIVARIPVGVGSIGVAVAPAGDRVYVTDVVENAVRVIDTSTSTVVATNAVCQGPFVAAMNPAGTRLYAAGLGGSITVIDATTDGFIASIALSTAPYWTALNGTRLYIANADANSIAIVDTTTNLVTGTIATGNGSRPLVVNVSPDGTRLYVQLTNVGDLAVYDTASLARAATIDYGAGSGAYGT